MKCFRRAAVTILILVLGAGNVQANESFIPASSDKSWGIIAPENAQPIRYAAMICDYPPETGDWFCLAVGCRASTLIEPYILNVGGDPYKTNAFAVIVDGEPIAAFETENVSTGGSHVHLGDTRSISMKDLVGSLSRGSEALVVYNQFAIRFPLAGSAAALASMQTQCLRVPDPPRR